MTGLELGGGGGPPRQLILKMNSEDQTVNHTNMFMGNDHDTIFVDFGENTSQEDKTLKIVLKGSLVVHRPRTVLDMSTYVLTDFDQ